MLDPRATRHPASDVAPDEEGYEQRQEQPHEARDAAPLSPEATGPRGREDRTHYGADYATEEQACPQGGEPPEDDTCPACSRTAPSTRFAQPVHLSRSPPEAVVMIVAEDGVRRIPK